MLIIHSLAHAVHKPNLIMFCTGTSKSLHTTPLALLPLKGSLTVKHHPPLALHEIDLGTGSMSFTGEKP